MFVKGGGMCCLTRAYEHKKARGLEFYRLCLCVHIPSSLQQTRDPRD
jgi:hypothetical protein